MIAVLGGCADKASIPQQNSSCSSPTIQSGDSNQEAILRSECAVSEPTVLLLCTGGIPVRNLTVTVLHDGVKQSYVRTMGESMPASWDPAPCLPLEFSPGISSVEVRFNQNRHSFSWTIRSEAEVSRNARNLAFGLIYGATLILFLYNGLLALSTGERIYISYALASIAAVLFQSMYLGHGMWFWPSGTVGLTSALPFTWFLFYGFAIPDFLRRLLKPDPGYKLKIAWSLECLGLACALSSLLWPHLFAEISYALTAPQFCFFFYLAAHRFRGGYQPAVFLLAGLLLSLITVLLHFARMQQWIQDVPILYYAQPIGSLLVLLFLSMALGSRIRIQRLTGMSARSREEFLRNLVNATPYPVLVMDHPLSGAYYWNPEAAKVYSVQDGFTLNERALNPGELRDLESSLKELGSVNRHLCSLRDADGLERQMAVSVRPIQFQNRKGFLHVHVDRTAELLAQKQSEEEQLALEQATIEASRATGIREDFIAAMSHEIRTPMAGIIAAAELLSDSRGRTGALGRILTRNARRLLALLNDILDFSRIRAGKMQTDANRFLVAEFPENALRSLQKSLQRNRLDLQYELDLHQDDAFIGDNNRMEQILERLAYALMRSRSNGRIDVSATLDGRHNEMVLQIAIRAPLTPGSDSGAWERLAASNRYYRPANARELNLMLARGLLELLGGQLQIRRSDAAGLDLSLRFPVQRAERAPQVTDSARPHQRLFILLFEDSPDNGVLLKRLLERQGHSVAIVDKAIDGLEWLRENLPDLILMDLHLPDMDGFEAARRIHSLNPHLTIVALSASTLDRDREAAREAGMVGFLAKPIQRKQFESLIEELFKRN
ncbi:MAG: response regulator [Leptospiraceae bacterium]|nr:response regulator [Leptospiraceae bacterium]